MKALLRLVLGVVSVALVLVIGAGFFVATLDPNDHKEWIIGKVQEETGRTLTLDGNIRLDLYPWIDLEVNGLALGNAPGFGDTPFLKMDYLNVRVKTIPLLNKKYEVDTVKVTGAQVNLARNAEGVTNWADLMKADGAESKPLPLTAIVLGGVDVQKAQLEWTDAGAGTAYKVKDLTFTTDKLVYGEPINLDLSTTVESLKPALSSDLKLKGIVKYDIEAGRYGVEPLTLDGMLRSAQLPGGQTPISFSAAVNADLDKDTASITGLKFSALQTGVSGEVQMTAVESGTPGVDATLDVQGEDLALLFRVLEVEPLATQLAGLSDRSFKVHTKLQADLARGDANLNELNAQVIGATVKGEVKAANVHSDTPSFKGTLSAAGPNLPMLLQVLGQVQGGSKSPLARVGKQIADFPQREFTFDTTFDADMKSGDIALPKLAAKLLGAEINADLTAKNANTKTPSFRGRISASGSDLPVLMQVAGALQETGQPAEKAGKEAAEGAKKTTLLSLGRKLGRVNDKSFDVKAEFDADLKSGNVHVPSLSANGLGLNVSGNVKTTGMSGSGGSATGQLSVTGEKLQGLLTALDQEGLGDTVRAIKFDTTIAGNGGTLTLKPLALDATVVSEELGNKPVKIAIGADVQANFDAQQLQVDALSVHGLGLDVKGNLKATNFVDAPEYAGRLDVAPFNLRQFMRQLKIKLPAMRDKEALKNVALQADLSGSKEDFKLDKFSAQLDESKINGNFSVQNFARPAVRFALEVDQIDLDRYGAPEEVPGAAPAKPATPVAAGAATPGRIPSALLRKVNVQGNIGIGRLVVAKARLNQVKVSVNGKDGVIKLDPITAKAYQGNHDANITLDVTGKLPKVTINIKVVGVQAEPLLKDVTGKAKARGTTNFSAALVTVGHTTPAFKRALNGQMSFSVHNGAIKGFNLGKILRQGKSLKDTFSLKVSESEETDLTEITGNPVATNGVVTLDDLKGAAPGMRISGKGIIANLPTHSLDYKLTATLVATSAGQGGKDLQEGKLEGVPLDCRLKGSLDDPKRDCDATKLLAALGLNVLQGVLGLPGKLLPGGSQAAPATTDQQLQQGTTAKKRKKAAAKQQQQTQDPVKDLTEGVKSLFKKKDQ